jgi:hypothetical protein
MPAQGRGANLPPGQAQREVNIRQQAAAKVLGRSYDVPNGRQPLGGQPSEQSRAEGYAPQATSKYPVYTGAKQAGSGVYHPTRQAPVGVSPKLRRA